MGYDKVLGSGGENVTPEVNEQGPLIQELRESLMGKIGDANATPEDILLGKSAYVGQKLVPGGLELVSQTAHELVSILPYEFRVGSAVIYNDEIHILGGVEGSTNHYKWDGTEWVSVSTLPYQFVSGSAVVWNNEIHILGGSPYNTNHYKWNGSAWTSVSTLPYQFVSGSAVVWNNEIHILGGGGSGSPYNTNHYKWNGSAWTSVSTLPYPFYQAAATVCKGAIHIIGSADGSGVGATDRSTNKHYRYNGSSWTSVSRIFYGFYSGVAITYKDEVHRVGNGSNSQTEHFKLHGSDWTHESGLPQMFGGGCVVIYKGKINMIGSIYEPRNRHYALDTELFTKRIVEVTT